MNKYIKYLNTYTFGIIMALISISLFVSCVSESIESNRTDNPNIKVDLVFTIDSTYKPGLYRFSDAGHYHYFVISPYKNFVENSYSSGKTTINDNIETK